MATGSLQEKKGKYYMVLSYKDDAGQWKTKWVSTGLKISGNKRKAQEILNNYLDVFEKNDNLLEPVQTDNHPQKIEEKPIEEKPIEEIESGKILFADYIEEWVERHRSQIESTTYASYKVQITSKISPYFRENGIYLEDLSPEDIETYYMERLKKVKANTVKHEHAYMRKCLQHAFEKGLIPSNPADRAQKPKVEQYVGDYYNTDDLKNLFSCIKGERMELPILLASYYGLRRSEVLGLKWNAIDFGYKTIAVRHTVTEATLDGKHQMVFKDRVKTKKSYRTLPLVKDFESLLLQKREQIAENKKMFGKLYKTEYDSYICVDEIGDLLKPGFITQNFVIILKKNNLKRIRFHDLRHSCATLLRHEGVPMEDIQKWLGHSNITTTEKIYAHFEDERHWNSAHKITNALSIGGYADDEDLHEVKSNYDFGQDYAEYDEEDYDEYGEEYGGDDDDDNNYESEKKDYEM